MDTAQWPQGIGVVKSVGDDENSSKKPRPQKEQPLNCPRCNSTNTKFCYYNNYSLSQPRYFCKTCRRYWTDGGSLRNIPVGGGSRKNKKSSSINPSSSKNLLPDPKFSSQNPKIHEVGHDLNLAYNHGMSSEFVALPFVLDAKNLNPQNPNISSFMSNFPVSNYHVNDNFKGFSVEGLENNYGNLQGVDQDHHSNSSRILFPFQEHKPVSADEFEENIRAQGGETNAYWNGMLAGGSW